MAKRGLKIFGLGIGGLIVVVGILVGILFATGVIKVPSKDSSSAGTTDGNKDEDDKKDILHPTKYCADVPNITSVERIGMSSNYRISFSKPIQDECVSSMNWWICQKMSNPSGQTRQGCQSFKPIPDQNYYDLTLDNYVQKLEGNIWLKIVSKSGGGETKESNKYPFTILPSN